ncbi:DoxX family protein [Parapedobacter sp. 2B3]|uniref:DoxX family protein n=1 Tax=Parapedobacter sp. 2B3 TaxID=3342381 RepID=UPI0035B6104E
MAALSSLSKFKNTGLLLIRIGLGIMFVMHGYPKLLGGPDRWEGVGSAMGNIGITFLPMFWGLLAALAETVGGVCFLLGLFFRPVAIALAFTMLIAALSHLGRGDGLMGASHAIEIGVVFLGLAFVGPGKYSVDKR